MTTKFPDLLPLPLVEEYSITPNEAIIRTQMESGTARQRRRFDSVPSRITVKWFMNASQFSLLRHGISIMPKKELSGLLFLFRRVGSD